MLHGRRLKIQGVSVRLSVKELFENHPMQWDLFILGLAEMKASNAYMKPKGTNNGVWESYYQIAGKISCKQTTVTVSAADENTPRYSRDALQSL
jgi:hypothetical protein